VLIHLRAGFTADDAQIVTCAQCQPAAGDVAPRKLFSTKRSQPLKAGILTLIHK
jgi:hypothetical protein